MTHLPLISAFAAASTFDPSELPPSALGNTTTFEATLPARHLEAFVEALGDTGELDLFAGQRPNRRRQVVTVSVTGPGPRILEVINAYLHFAQTRH